MPAFYISALSSAFSSWTSQPRDASQWTTKRFSFINAFHSNVPLVFDISPVIVIWETIDFQKTLCFKSFVGSSSRMCDWNLNGILESPCLEQVNTALRCRMFSDIYTSYLHLGEYQLSSLLIGSRKENIGSHPPDIPSTAPYSSPLTVTLATRPLLCNLIIVSAVRAICWVVQITRTATVLGSQPEDRPDKSCNGISQLWLMCSRSQYYKKYKKVTVFC